jgi:hypothetical protein
LGCELSYTGIQEIDMVLLDLYGEQVKLEKRLQRNPNSVKLSERHRHVANLTDKLLTLGQVLQVNAGVDQSSA